MSNTIIEVNFRLNGVITYLATQLLTSLHGYSESVRYAWDLNDVSRHSCVCSTPDSMINTQMCLYLFYKEKSVMTLISITHDQSLSPYPCIYDAYIVIRRIQNYRDSTLSKNHPIILLTHPSHSSSHSHLHLSHLSPTLMVIRPSPITGLHLS